MFIGRTAILMSRCKERCVVRSAALYQARRARKAFRVVRALLVLWDRRGRRAETERQGVRGLLEPPGRRARPDPWGLQAQLGQRVRPALPGRRVSPDRRGRRAETERQEVRGLLEQPGRLVQLPLRWAAPVFNRCGMCSSSSSSSIRMIMR